MCLQFKQNIRVIHAYIVCEETNIAWNAVFPRCIQIVHRAFVVGTIIIHRHTPTGAQSPRHNSRRGCQITRLTLSAISWQDENERKHDKGISVTICYERRRIAVRLFFFKPNINHTSHAHTTIEPLRCLCNYESYTMFVSPVLFVSQCNVRLYVCTLF